MASNAAAMRPPVEDSATAIVSPRAFSRRAAVSARPRSCSIAPFQKSEDSGQNARNDCAMPDARPTPSVPDDDPYLWLEEIEGDKALAWVDTETRRTLARFDD